MRATVALLPQIGALLGDLRGDSPQQPRRLRPSLAEQAPAPGQGADQGVRGGGPAQRAGDGGAAAQGDDEGASQGPHAVGGPRAAPWVGPAWLPDAPSLPAWLPAGGRPLARMVGVHAAAVAPKCVARALGDPHQPSSPEPHPTPTCEFHPHPDPTPSAPAYTPQLRAPRPGSPARRRPRSGSSRLAPPRPAPPPRSAADPWRPAVTTSPASGGSPRQAVAALLQRARDARQPRHVSGPAVAAAALAWMRLGRVHCAMAQLGRVEG